jgi:hypothetical protein
VDAKSWYKVDTELIHKFLLTSYRLRMNFLSEMIQSGYEKLVQSCYRVDTQVCINFLSTPFELFVKVDTQWIRNVGTGLIHKFVSICGANSESALLAVFS